MRGNITRRGKSSYRLKFDVGLDPTTGKRITRFITIRGKRQDAEAKLAAELAALDNGTSVEPSKVTVADFVRARVKQWEEAGTIGARTAERYNELIENQIAPHIGNTAVQKLKPIHVDAWHGKLRTDGRKDGKGGISARTIGHAHRVLSKALREAVKFDVAFRNVAGKDGQAAPKVQSEEVEIIAADRIADVVAKLKGRAIYPKAVTALFTGLRRGELLALRLRSIDLDAKLIRVREALEETKKGGVQFKATKTASGRRDISLPDIVVDALRDHRRALLEIYLQGGLGKPDDDALLFPAMDFGPQSPRNLSGDWREVAPSIGLEGVTFHALRHTHASQLIDAGIDVVRISKRLGHASPAITLRIYAHLFRQHDEKSAEAINAALATIGRSPGA